MRQHRRASTLRRWLGAGLALAALGLVSARCNDDGNQDGGLEVQCPAGQTPEIQCVAPGQTVQGSKLPATRESEQLPGADRGQKQLLPAGPGRPDVEGRHVLLRLLRRRLLLSPGRLRSGSATPCLLHAGPTQWGRRAVDRNCRPEIPKVAGRPRLFAGDRTVVGKRLKDRVLEHVQEIPVQSSNAAAVHPVPGAPGAPPCRAFARPRVRVPGRGTLDRFALGRLRLGRLGGSLESLLKVRGGLGDRPGDGVSDLFGGVGDCVNWYCGVSDSHTHMVPLVVVRLAELDCRARCLRSGVVGRPLPEVACQRGPESQWRTSRLMKASARVRMELE